VDNVAQESRGEPLVPRWGVAAGGVGVAAASVRVKPCYGFPSNRGRTL